jgi:hypothetical protein
VTATNVEKTLAMNVTRPPHRMPPPHADVAAMALAISRLGRDERYKVRPHRSEVRWRAKSSLLLTKERGVFP